MTQTTLLVGLGNPGPEYEKTRHNAGAWLIENIADHKNTPLRLETKFHGLCGKISVAGRSCQLLLPTTFMNHSGRSIKAIAHFYKITPENIFIAHDELDIPCGTVKLKKGGGHGGHNGLRDTCNALGSNDFYRIRIGIGHPGHKDKVLNYVLGLPSKEQRTAIEDVLGRVEHSLKDIMSGNIQKAMQQLHSET